METKSTVKIVGTLILMVSAGLLICNEYIWYEPEYEIVEPDPEVVYQINVYDNETHTELAGVGFFDIIHLYRLDRSDPYTDPEWKLVRSFSSGWSYSTDEYDTLFFYIDAEGYCKGAVVATAGITDIYLPEGNATLSFGCNYDGWANKPV